MLQRLARELLVADDKAEMAVLVAGYLIDFVEGGKLVAQVDKAQGLAFAAQFKLQELSVEGESLIYITNL